MQQPTTRSIFNATSFQHVRIEALGPRPADVARSRRRRVISFADSEKAISNFQQRDKALSTSNAISPQQEPAEPFARRQ